MVEAIYAYGNQTPASGQPPQGEVTGTARTRFATSAAATCSTPVGCSSVDCVAEISPVSAILAQMSPGRGAARILGCIAGG